MSSIPIICDNEPAQTDGDHVVDRIATGAADIEMFPLGYNLLTSSDLQQNIPVREQVPVWTTAKAQLTIERRRPHEYSDR